VTVEEREGLPEGWAETTFGELNTYRSGNVDPAEHADETFELYSVPNFPKGVPEFQPGEAIGSTKQSVQPDDVLVCKINPRINRVWKVGRASEHRQIGSSEWVVFRAPDVYADFFKHYFRGSEFRELLCTDLTGVGGSLTRAQPSKVATFPVPLPPLPEQIRIADKLDAILARVDAGRERLERVPKLVKRFRQSVLSAAVSGELTREWRGGGDAAWEEKPLNQVAISKLGKMLDQSKNTGTLTPYLRNVNVRWFDFQLDDVSSLRVKETERLALMVKRGDVLICEGGEPGRCAVWNGEAGQFIYQKALHRVRVGSELNAHWLTFCLKNAADSGALEDYFTGTTIKHFTGASLAQFLLPIPPLPEQLEIVRRVEALFAIADRLEQRYQTALISFQRLTPALLAKAFRGELVPQDPADEPASVLLERIRAGRAAEGTGRERARKPGKAAGENGAEPKRRGRPPKAQAEDGNGAAEPKWRGRPPKAQADGTPIIEASSYEDAVRRLEAQKRARAQRADTEGARGTRLVGLFEE
jgi:type I restriction enzyme S subunit